MREAANRRSRRKGAREDRQTENRTSLYDEVTGRIISEMEAGRLPWVQPWGSTGSAGPGLPRNALTARNYSGVNVLILWGAVIEHGWPSQSWLTFLTRRSPIWDRLVGRF
jgi:antirestriction protein ArdC